MAKGQQRSGRETKKPKQNKTKTTEAPSRFIIVPSKPTGAVKPDAGRR